MPDHVGKAQVAFSYYNEMEGAVRLCTTASEGMALNFSNEIKRWIELEVLWAISGQQTIVLTASD